MTIKGLEPELSRMVEVKQNEIFELKQIHRNELEAVELKAIHKTSELIDQLRAELLREKEFAIERETNILRTRFCEKKFSLFFVVRGAGLSNRLT